jgi:YD repeat-containing protein
MNVHPNPDDLSLGSLLKEAYFDQCEQALNSFREFAKRSDIPFNEKTVKFELLSLIYFAFDYGMNLARESGKSEAIREVFITALQVPNDVMARMSSRVMEYAKAINISSDEMKRQLHMGNVFARHTGSADDIMVVMWATATFWSNAKLMSTFVRDNGSKRAGEVSPPRGAKREDYRYFFYFVFSYDEQGRQIQADYYDLKAILLWYETIEYNEKGHKGLETRYDPGGRPIHVNRFAYDEMNRLVGLNEGEEIYQYDEQGRLVHRYYRTTGPGYQRVDYEYDDLHRETKQTHHREDGTPFGPSIREYDREGRLASVRELDTVGNAGGYQEYEYDSAGRLITDCHYRADGVLTSQRIHEYDEEGRRTRLYVLMY